MTTTVKREPVRRKQGSVAPPPVGGSIMAGQAAGGEAPKAKPQRTSSRFSVRIAVDVFDRLEARCDATGQSYSEVLTEAFQTVGSNYTHLAAVARPHQGPPQRSTPKRNRQRGETKDLSVYYDRGQQEWLDEQVETGGAPSRTELIEKALHKFLDRA